MRNTIVYLIYIAYNLYFTKNILKTTKIKINQFKDIL